MKGFEKTKFATILNKVKEVAKDKGAEVAGIAAQAMTGNIPGAIKSTVDLLRNETSMPAKEVLIELENEKEAIENELFRIGAQDAQNARDNETARDTSEHASFLSKNIHEIIALVVVGSWIVSWWVSPKGFSADDIFKAVFLILGYLYGRTKPQS